MRHPSSKRNDAGGNPPAVPLPGGVKVARRFVKPHGVGASPTLAANFNLRFPNDDLRAAGCSQLTATLQVRREFHGWLAE